MPRAYVYAQHGGPEVQTLVEVEKPLPGPGELLVAVRAAGVNPADWKRRSAYNRPMVVLEHPVGFGVEASGVVEAVGGGVNNFVVGDEVFGSVVGDGAYADYAIFAAEETAMKPPTVSFTDAATLPVAAATAYDGIHELGLSPGQTLLINGVGGGVGVASAQIAIDLGLEVIGTASPQKKDFVESLGVVHVAYGDGVVERVRAAAPNGIDGIYDLVGGDALRSVAELVSDRSKIVAATDPVTATEVGGNRVTRINGPAVLDAVAQLVATGALNPFVTEIFPFDQAAEALERVESGHARGKVVVQVS